ncbi:MAG TPA: hypothetical protein PLF89_14830 [bacterium]|nr:hypothetical protein [bacterium]
MSGRKLATGLLIWLITVSAVQAQVIIQAQVLQRDLRLFFLSDLNLTGRGRATNEVFSISIINSAAIQQICCLHMDLSKQEGGRSQLLASGTTNPFTLAAGRTIRITNVNLFSQAQQFSLDDYAIEDEGEEVQSRILATGKLPTGLYRFTFLISPCSGSGFSPSETYIEFDVSNPTSLDLIGPGEPADRALPGLSPTLFPLFRWNSNLSRFKLTVAEKLAGVHDAASPAEIIQDRIRFERLFTVDPARSGGIAPDGSEYISGTSYPYPSAGAWPLEEGKTYYWRITGVAPSSGAEAEFPSEIWAFRTDAGGMHSLEIRAGMSEMIASLRPASGEGMAPLFRSGGELDGFTLTGRYWLNGRWITYEQLQAILIKLSTGEYKLIESRIE